MKKITLNEAKTIGNKLKINFKVIPLKEWRDAMQIELEHGKHNNQTNVTANNLLMTGKIALAHYKEFPDYYVRLFKMEEQANKYWENKKKPCVILKKV
jgi:hypothetical protein